jgi:hypothetical protein
MLHRVSLCPAASSSGRLTLDARAAPFQTRERSDALLGQHLRGRPDLEADQIAGLLVVVAGPELLLRAHRSVRGPRAELRDQIVLHLNAWLRVQRT